LVGTYIFFKIIRFIKKGDKAYMDRLLDTTKRHGIVYTEFQNGTVRMSKKSLESLFSQIDSLNKEYSSYRQAEEQGLLIRLNPITSDNPLPVDMYSKPKYCTELKGGGVE
jgi:hypothetical protein